VKEILSFVCVPIHSTRVLFLGTSGCGNQKQQRQLPESGRKLNKHGYGESHAGREHRFCTLVHVGWPERTTEPTRFPCLARDTAILDLDWRDVALAHLVVLRCGAALSGGSSDFIAARGSRQVGVSLLSRYQVTDQVGPGYLTQPSAERYTDTNPISDRRSASCVYMCSVCNESSAQCLRGQVSFSLSKQSVRQIYIDFG
jgi:hypothetical protein